jgi:DNA-binding NarL/FixJ family response regulator
MVRILIASDSLFARKRLKFVIGLHSGWIVCGETGNGLKAVLLANELKPDLVILDLAMPMLDGLHAADEISKILPKTPIVIYSPVAMPQQDLVSKSAGVWAMVSQTENEGALVETVELLLRAGATPQAETDPNSSSKSQTNGNGNGAPMLDPLPEAE